MATAIACANGNFTTAATWATVFAGGTGVPFLDSEAGNTALTTSYVESVTFTPGAITIDGLAVKIATRAAVPSGTMSVRIALAGVTQGSTETFINVSDIVGTALLQNGWYFFKFASSFTFAAATAYTMSAKTSVAAQVNLYRDATGGNWSRMLRGTTTAALAATDNWFILGEWTAAATVTARTVTMDQTVATNYGGSSTSLTGAGIGVSGTLTWGTTAATTYILQEAAVMTIWAGGTMNMGTTVTPMPRDATGTLQFNCAADGDFGLQVYGTLVCQGQSRISGVNNHTVLLNANAIATATALTTDSQLSAKSGDAVAIASTTRTNSECETKNLNVDAGATSLTLTAGLTNAHSGTSPTQAEIVSLTRAVSIQAVTAGLCTYITLNTGCAFDADWAQFRYLGGSATVGKRGLEWAGTSGSVDINKCTFRDCDTNGFYAANASGVGQFSITDTVCWAHSTASTGSGFLINESTTNTWTMTGNVSITPNTNATGFTLNDVGGTFSNNKVAGGTFGIQMDETAANVTQKWNGTYDTNSVHSCSSNGVTWKNGWGGTLSNWKVWRCNATGMTTSPGSNGMFGDMLITNLVMFGNTTQNFLFGSAANAANITFRGLQSNGDTTFSTATGMTIVQGIFPNIRFEACNFSVVSGIFTAHATADIALPASSGVFSNITLVNTTLASATEISNTSSLMGRSYIAYEKHEGVADANQKVYPQLGTVSKDTSVFRTASPSEKLAPSAAIPTMRLPSSPKRVAVGSGQSCTISVYVLKSALYAGSAPRLRVANNSAAGVSEATVATFVGAASVWVQVTGSVGPVTENCWLEYSVDCDGSAGQINLDDWSAAVA